MHGPVRQTFAVSRPNMGQPGKRSEPNVFAVLVAQQEREAIGV